MFFITLPRRLCEKGICIERMDLTICLIDISLGYHGFFIPLTIFSYDTSKILFIIANFIGLFYLICILKQHFYSQITFPNLLFIFSTSIFMCWLLFKVGQMDFILAGITVAVMSLIGGKKQIQAGLFFPILLFKPHLLTLFIQLPPTNLLFNSPF
jgi:hypothetical protein